MKMIHVTARDQARRSRLCTSTWPTSSRTQISLSTLLFLRSVSDNANDVSLVPRSTSLHQDYKEVVHKPLALASTLLREDRLLRRLDSPR